MRWRVHSERRLYRDKWLDLKIADVELPDGQHIDHRVLRVPESACAVVLDSEARALLLWRHRFLTNTWGWEVPGGWVEAGEQPVEAAARETEEETGWRAGPMRPLLCAQPLNGISDGRQHVFLAEGATLAGEPSDGWEAERVAWVPLADVPRLVAERKIVSSLSIAALLYVLTFSRSSRRNDEGAGAPLSGEA